MSNVYVAMETDYYGSRIKIKDGKSGEKIGHVILESLPYIFFLISVDCYFIDPNHLRETIFSTVFLFYQFSPIEICIVESFE